MVYSFEVIQRTNIRYREEAAWLARCELSMMLRALPSEFSDVQVEKLGGVPFLTFEGPECSPPELTFLRGHSSLALMSEKSGSSLRPLETVSPDYLPEDLPEVLKYKGKTSVSFTRMMLNIALSLSGFALSERPITVMDPLCGKGTTLFCALQRGFNAVGLDTDHKAIHEATEYFSRYLKYHQMKHRLSSRSETLEKGALPVSEFIVADTREHFQAGHTRVLSLSTGDTALSPALVRRKPVQLLVTDFPYGVKHAPQTGQRTESFRSLLKRALPAWRKALRPGGILAVSFNTLTLPFSQVAEALQEAGFKPFLEEPFLHFRHEVEQAVVRDVIFAISDKEES